MSPNSSPPALVNYGLCPVRPDRHHLIRWAGWCPDAELETENTRLREAAAARDEAAAAQLAAERARADALAARVDELERRLAKDSSTSSRPPSSDSPYTKKPKDRSLRRRSGRKPGKQPGAPSSTLRQSASPGRTVVCEEARRRAAAAGGT